MKFEIRNKTFGLYLLGFLIMLILFSVGAYYYAKRNVQKEVEIQSQKVSALVEVNLQEKMLNIEDHISFLTRATELEFNKDKEAVEHIEQLYLNFSQTFRYYDQIRFLDTEGTEKVRVNYKDGVASLVPEDQLQSKKHRYYFADAMKVPDGNIYMSPLDLNIEHNQIEQPLKPMLRIAQKVRDEKGDTIGVVLLNYLADHILNVVKEFESEGQIWFVNEKGYYFIADSPDKEWGFMYDDKKELTFQNEFPPEGEIILKQESGQFQSDNGAFTYFSLSPVHYSDNLIDIKSVGKWHLVIYVSNDIIAAKIVEFYEGGFIYMAFATLLILILLWFVASFRASKIDYQKQLEVSNDELRASLETKNKFFSIISHDLRSPFATFVGYTDLVGIQGDQMEKDELLNIFSVLDKSAKATYKLLEDLLSWARMQSGKLKASPQVYPIEDSITKVVTVAQETAHKKEIKLTSDVTKGNVFADQNMITTVIRNIISNAIKFTPRGGGITVSTYIEDVDGVDFMVVKIKDNGVGMPPEVAENLFNLSKGGNSLRGTEDEEGTGFGLILCKNLVELNGGDIQLKSVINEGTQFCFTVPLS